MKRRIQKEEARKAYIIALSVVALTMVEMMIGIAGIGYIYVTNPCNYLPGDGYIAIHILLYISYAIVICRVNNTLLMNLLYWRRKVMRKRIRAMRLSRRLRAASI